MKPTVHLIGPGPHSETTLAWTPDAYSAKTRRLGDMLTSRGYKVVLYGGTRNESNVSQFVPLVSFEERERWMPNFSPHLEVWSNYDVNIEPWRVFNARAAAEVRKRAQPSDILGLTMGGAHKPIADALGDLKLYVVETGIGYAGVWAPFRVWESRAWETYMAGRDQIDHRQFDVVIPNAYDPDELPLGTGQGGYHLFASRFVARKGVAIAAQATKALGVPLVIIGPDLLEHTGNTYRGVDTSVEGDHITHLGPVGPKDRAQIMGAAIAIWTPTLYCEPFGGVGVEANFTGTPIIASDFGAFQEQVSHGFNGYLCRTLQQFVDAGRAAPNLNRAAIRENAISRWSTAVVAPMYDAYFQQLMTLSGEGWATLRKEGTDGQLVEQDGLDVQPGTGEGSREADGGGAAPPKLPVRRPARVGRGRSVQAATDNLAVRRPRNPHGPTLRAVGD